GHVHEVVEVLSVDREAVEVIDHRIPLVQVRRVARRQHDHHLALDLVAFEVAFERGAMDLDLLDRDPLGNRWRRRGYVLRGGGSSQQRQQRACDECLHGASLAYLSRCSPKNGSTLVRMRSAMRLPWSPS